MSIGLATILGTAGTAAAQEQQHANSVKASADQKELIGRWDITIDQNGKPSPPG